LDIFFQQKLNESDVGKPIYTRKEDSFVIFNQVVLTPEERITDLNNVVTLVEKEKVFYAYRLDGKYSIVKKDDVIMKSFLNKNYYVSLYPSVYELTEGDRVLQLVGCFGNTLDSSCYALFNINELKITDAFEDFRMMDLEVIRGTYVSPATSPFYSPKLSTSVDAADNAIDMNTEEDQESNPKDKLEIDILKKELVDIKIKMAHIHNQMNIDTQLNRGVRNEGLAEFIQRELKHFGDIRDNMYRELEKKEYYMEKKQNKESSRVQFTLKRGCEVQNRNI